MEIKVITEKKKYLFDNFNAMEQLIKSLELFGIDYFITIKNWECN